MQTRLWKDLTLLIAVTLSIQSIHFFADWDETLWGMEGAFYGIGVKNFSRFEPEEHRFLLIQNGSPEVEEPLRYYARALMPYYWAEGLSVFLFGDRPWAYRIVSVFHGWLLAIFLYLLVLEFSSRRTALIAGILVGASPMVGYYSTCAYSGPAAGYIPAALWAFSRWRKSGERRHASLLAFFLFLCWAGTYFNLFFLPVLIALHGWFGGRWLRFSLLVLSSFAAVHALQLLHIVTVDPTLKIFFGNVFEWTVARPDANVSGYSLSVLANVGYTLARLMTPMTLGLALFGAFALFDRASSERSSIPYLIALFIPGIFLFLVFPGHTLVHEHDFYWFAAPMAWLAAFGVDAALKSEGKRTLALLFLFILCGALFYRGNLICWYRPGQTGLLLFFLSIPMAFLLLAKFVPGSSPKTLVIVLGLWVFSSFAYTQTLWSDETRVEEAVFVKDHSTPHERIARVGRVYPLDLFYAERSMKGVEGPASQEPAEIRAWLERLKVEGFDRVLLPARFPNREMVKDSESLLTSTRKEEALLIRIDSD